MTPLQSLVASGTKLWLDSVDPDEVATQPGERGHRGDLQPDHHRRPDQDRPLRRRHQAVPRRRARTTRPSPGRMTDKLVKARPGRVPAGLGARRRATTATSASSWTRCSKTRPATCRSPSGRRQYIELGKKWAAGHKNRMIKVPATPGGLGGAGRAGRRRRHAQRDARSSASGSTRPPATPSGAASSGAVDRDTFKIGLQHLRQPAGRVHREARARTCRRRRRGWSASSTPSGSGR